MFKRIRGPNPLNEGKMKDEGLVQIGKHEMDKGKSLGRIHSKFIREGVDEGTAIKVLKKIEAAKKIKEAEAYEKAASEQKNTKDAEPPKKQSSFLVILVLLAFAGIILYLYFAGGLTFEWAGNLMAKFR